MSAYDITLTDATTTASMPSTNVPLTTNFLEGTVDVQTLSFDVYTDFITQKRLWSHTWSYMTEDEFNVLKAFYDRQFTLYQYPLLTIVEESVSLVPVRMTLSPKKIIDNCGTVEDVTVTFRESKQQDPFNTGYVLLEGGDLLSVGTGEDLGL